MTERGETVAARVVVVADEPVRADAAVQALRAGGFAVPDVIDAGPEPVLPAGVVVVLGRGLAGALELCRWLQAGTLAFAVLLFGAFEDPGAVLRAGAQPWSHRWDAASLALELRLLARGWADRPPSRRARILAVGPLEIDTARHAVRVQGEPRHLTSQSYQLLLYLIDADGAVVTPKAITRDVVGVRALENPRNPVSALRRALRPFGHDLIKTVNGEGWVLPPDFERSPPR